jgi:hypothetical protein
MVGWLGRRAIANKGVPRCARPLDCPLPSPCSRLSV